MKNIAILGSTGSIGVNALRVIVQMPGAFRVVALSAKQRHRPGARLPSFAEVLEVDQWARQKAQEEVAANFVHRA